MNEIAPVEGDVKGKMEGSKTAPWRTAVFQGQEKGRKGYSRRGGVGVKGSRQKN